MNDSGFYSSEHDCTGDAAAYVLGALDDHELAPFLRHLDDCAVCRDEVASLQVVADMLPASVTPVTAPRGLRRRVLATVYEEAELFRAAGAPTAARAARPRRRSWAAIPRPFQALAAGALVAAGIAVGVVALGSGPSVAPTRFISASTTPPTTAVLRVAPGRTELDVSSLAPAPKGRVYEVWIQHHGEPHPTDALFTPTSDGRATVAVPGAVAAGDVVMVTDEPSGGSLTPTRTPLIRAALK
jgi:anti-sigma-K factor RskA